MYARPSDRVENRAVALEVLAAAPFVHLVSMGEAGFEATSLPMFFDEKSGRLSGHLARANSHWQAVDGQPVVVIAVASESYVSPSWYASKDTNDGKVVPTWNYEAVYIHGMARVHHDPEWLADVVHRLTERHESHRTDGGDRWAASDAPPEFIDKLLKGIVGLSVSADRIEAKQKLSTNHDEADQAGVVEGLSNTTGAPARMIAEMSRALGSDDEG